MRLVVVIVLLLRWVSRREVASADDNSRAER